MIRISIIRISLLSQVDIGQVFVVEKITCSSALAGGFYRGRTDSASLFEKPWNGARKEGGDNDNAKTSRRGLDPRKCAAIIGEISLSYINLLC